MAAMAVGCITAICVCDEELAGLCAGDDGSLRVPPGGDGPLPAGDRDLAARVQRPRPGLLGGQARLRRHRSAGSVVFWVLYFSVKHTCKS